MESISVYQEPWVAMIRHHPLACADGAPVRLEELLPYELIIRHGNPVWKINSWFGIPGKSRSCAVGSPICRCL
ncbi:MAG: hypothetical protein ACLR84_06805 [Clostridia bacterium]